MDYIIETHNLSKVYDNFTAVNEVSFSVKKGQTFGLLGPNGAGKTTTIRLLCGMSPATSGSLKLFGQKTTDDWRELKAKLGVCGQDNSLDPDLSVLENLVVFAGYFNIKAAKAKVKAWELLEFFSLDHKADAKVEHLSGGLARRLMLARSLINDPELLVLDEPTTGLDPQSRHLLWDKLSELKKSGLSILLTTHYMEEAQTLCDYLVIMDNSRILVGGKPKELVQEYIGELVMEVRNPPAGLAERIQSLGLTMENLSYSLTVFCRSADINVFEKLRAEIEPRICTVRPATLEDVFLRLTGRELRE